MTVLVNLQLQPRLPGYLPIRLTRSKLVKNYFENAFESQLLQFALFKQAAILAAEPELKLK